MKDTKRKNLLADLKYYIQATKLIMTTHENNKGTPIMQIRTTDGKFASTGELQQALENSSPVFDSIFGDDPKSTQALEILSTELDPNVAKQKLLDLGISNPKIEKAIAARNNLKQSIDEYNSTMDSYKGEIFNTVFKFVADNYKTERGKERFIKGFDSAISDHHNDWQQLDKNLAGSGKSIVDSYKAYQKLLDDLKNAKTEDQVVDILSRVAGNGLDLTTKGLLFIGLGPFFELVTGGSIVTAGLQVALNHAKMEALKASLDVTQAPIILAGSLAKVSDPHLIGILVGGLTASSLVNLDQEEFKEFRKYVLNHDLYKEYKKILKMVKELKSQNLTIEIDFDKLNNKNYNPYKEAYAQVQSSLKSS